MFVDTLLSTKKPFPKRYTQTPIYIEEYDITEENLQVDQWKVYPCSTVPWTDIEKWFKDGSYTPYDDEKLMDLVINIKTFVFPWIRLNRIIRDIPSDYIMNDHSRPNMRQDAKVVMEKEGKTCACIRCREVKGKEFIKETAIVRVRIYKSSGGWEYFISSETQDTSVLYGFLRLRLPSSRYNTIFPELADSSLIRELHVYGQLQKVGSKEISTSPASQHKGIGRMLVDVAEEISKQHGYKKVSIIAGEGTRGYYERLGYHHDDGVGGFMQKSLAESLIIKSDIIINGL
jgi:ELP3 family radical SAM enzyme/protein acetyltransferase